MRISPENWGPAFWKTFHVACLVSTDRDEIQKFVDGYKLVIPCGSCRVHFMQLIDENPIPADEYFMWSVDIHNLVNARLGKPQFSYENAIAALQVEPSKFDYNIAMLLIAMIIIVAFLFLNRK